MKHEERSRGFKTIAEKVDEKVREAQRARKFKFSSFQVFPSSKIEFWPFLTLQKMDFGQKIFCEIDLFDFTIFFWPGLF